MRSSASRTRISSTSFSINLAAAEYPARPAPTITALYRVFCCSTRFPSDVRCSFKKNGILVDKSS